MGAPDSLICCLHLNDPVLEKLIKFSLNFCLSRRTIPVFFDIFIILIIFPILTFLHLFVILRLIPIQLAKPCHLKILKNISSLGQKREYFDSEDSKIFRHGRDNVKFKLQTDLI